MPRAQGSTLAAVPTDFARLEALVHKFDEEAVMTTVLTREAKPTCKSLSAHATPKEKALNVIFMPYNYKGDMATFEADARTAVGKFGTTFPPLDPTNPGLNLLAVTAEVPNEDGTDCTNPVTNVNSKYDEVRKRWDVSCTTTGPDDQVCIQRLVTCDTATYRKLADEHCASEGVFVFMYVLFRKEGANGGGANNEIAAMIKPNMIEGQDTVAHELGHGLFGLADEYTYGWGDDTSPNCDTAGCAKWADLAKAEEFKSAGIGCFKACKGGGYFAAQDQATSVMNTYAWSPEQSVYGPVNERISCCKYLFHGFEPTYCAKFTSADLNLKAFCTAQIWKDATGKAVAPVTTEILAQMDTKLLLQTRANDPQGERMVFVEKPAKWELVAGSAGTYTCQLVETLPMGIYRQEHVEGETHTESHGARDHVTGPVSDDIQVHATDAKGAVLRTLPFHKHSTFEIEAGANGKFPVEADGKDDAILRRSRITVILNQGEGCKV